ncbi:ABC transporter permease [Actinokineospora cianjurensis]|uniref:Putative ABC transport system permease protein n=1 Tax=Actinokineospora cianjurensis TaxID=585224 RepID=A0A421B3Y6_9PSEU|nr:ABC transporter permease [Actinokineospora cianjurensis]RLK59087.1 putative ABC transport system permease protein [Actinokineospora cianjurensis]
MQLPWRAAPRAAVSSPLTVLVAFVAALLLSFVGAAAVLHADSAGSAAVAYQAGRLCGQTVPPVVDGNRVSVADAGDVLRISAEQGRVAGFDTIIGAVYSPVRQWDFNGPHPWSQFGYRDGAMDNLRVVEGGSRDGLWVPRSIAQDAGIKIGDRGLDGTLPPVTAIYADVSDPVPAYWCSEQQRIMPNPLATEGATAAVVWFPTLDSFTASMSPVSGNAAAVSVRFPAPTPATTDEAAALVARGKTVVDGVTTQLRARDKARLVIASNYFAKPVEVARSAESTVLGAVLPLTVISLLVGLAGVGAVTVQWVQRRHAELRLLWARGAGPVVLGWRAVLELAAPLLLGAAAGLLAARLALPWYAPSTALTDGTVGVAALVAAGVLVAALLVVGAVTATRTHREFQSGSTRGASRVWRFVPWELITAALAYLAWARLDSMPTKLQFGQPLPQNADAVGLAFPLLVVLTVALVTVRLARWALTAAHRADLWRTPAVHLALRRLSAAAGSAVGILLVGTLAVGTLTVGVGVADAQSEALDTKSGLFVGAESTAQIPGRVAIAGLPPALAQHATVVGVVKTGQSIVLAVDPATFTRSAWLGDRDPDDVAAQLSTLSGSGVRALRVGSTPDAPAELPRVGTVRPVGQVASFPLIGTGRGYVVSLASLPDPARIDVWQVWSARSSADLVADLDAAGIHHLHSRSKALALDGLPFLTVTWTFDFVTALGMVLAIVAAAALVLAVEVRRRQNALAGALATRMGLRQRTLVASHLTELGSLAGISVAAGSAAGAVCAAVSAPMLDPSPWLRPVAAAPNLVPLVSTTTLVAAVVVALVCWSAVRSVTTARVGELIRG